MSCQLLKPYESDEESSEADENVMPIKKKLLLVK